MEDTKPPPKTTPAPDIVQPTDLTASTATPMSAQPNSPYVDQQVLPGQVIGYGLPTDQQVFSSSATNKHGNKKIVTGLIIAILLLVMTAGIYLFVISS